MIYLVSDRENMERAVFLEKIESACRAGISYLQLREKNAYADEFYKLGKEVKLITDSYKIPLIINDRLDVAIALKCGVHLGADDLDIALARELMGSEAIIGATAKTVERALQSQEKGASYLGVGAIYPTTTKVKTVLTSVDTLKDIVNAVSIPVFAIGGLNAENMYVLNGSGISGVAVVSAIMKNEDSYKATLGLIEKFAEI